MQAGRKGLKAEHAENGHRVSQRKQRKTMRDRSFHDFLSDLCAEGFDF
jgi:hypothetical protein